MENYSQTKKWILCTAIFAASCMPLILSPIVQTLANNYPDVSLTTVRSLTSIPSLISCICCLFLSAVIGKLFSYKTALVAGTAFLLVGGIVPIFWNTEFSYLLIARVIQGIGFTVFAMRNVIITKAFGTDESAKWTGNGFFIASAISIIMTMVSGKLGDLNWKYCYLLHLITVPMIIVILWLYKDNKKELKVARTEEKPTESEKGKSTPHPLMFLYCILTLLAILCVFPILSSISIFIAERGVGAATESGWATSAYTLGGALFGFAFGAACKKYDRWLLPASCVTVILGYILTLSAVSGPALAVIGSGLTGAGFSWFMLTTTQWAKDVSNLKNRAFSMTLISFCVSGGSYLSSYFMLFAKAVGKAIPLFETETEKTFLVGIILYAIMFVISSAKDLRPKSLLKTVQN